MYDEPWILGKNLEKTDNGLISRDDKGINLWKIRK